MRKAAVDRTSAKVKRWTVTAIYALCILYVSTREMGDVPSIPYIDKAVHFVMYAILAILCAWSLRAYLHYSWRRILGISFLMTTLYGFLTEFIQMFVPTRDAELLDLVSNMAGALAGAWIAYFIMGSSSRDDMEVDDDGRV